MKNKRKYDDALPATAENISKQNLDKLRKLAKPDSPLVKEIRSKATDILADRKNANYLIDLIGYLDVSEPASVALAAIQSVRRVFIALLEKNLIKAAQDKDSETTGPAGAEEQYAAWLHERFIEGTQRMCELLHHAKAKVVQQSVATLMSLLQCQNWSNKTHTKSATNKDNGKVWTDADQKLMQGIVLALCSRRVSSSHGLNRFQEFLEYADVSQQFMLVLGRVVVQANRKGTVNFVFVDNVISCLEKFDLPDKTKLLNCPNFLGTKKQSTSPDEDYDRLIKSFGTVWMNLLKCKFNMDQYKRTLIMLNEKVIPLLPRPLLLTDFLLSSFNVGGPISMLALSGVFTLITKYNLEFPDFYSKLYELFTVEIFYVKYKARFFHLSDVFLSSTHLSQAIVASFVKRLARITLQAPAHTIPLAIKFIHNLLHRHKGLARMLHDPDRTDLRTDPFRPDETDPALTGAVDSSLWEIKTLASHLLPSVSSVAKDLVDKGLKESEKDLSESLETTTSDLLDVELKKKVFVNVPLNWEPPNGLRLASNDFLSTLVAIA